jgi:hypothetical protein
MRRKLAVLAAGVAAVAAVTATALAVVPGETPFPSPTTMELMVTANTTNGSAPDAIHTSRFLHNATVFFHVFAASVKTKQVLTAEDVRYAFIRIPNQPNVQLTYRAPTKRNGANFVGTWQVPTTYPLGLVNFTVRFQTRDRQFGNFVQIPVETSQLTIVK